MISLVWNQCSKSFLFLNRAGLSNCFCWTAVRKQNAFSRVVCLPDCPLPKVFHRCLISRRDSLNMQFITVNRFLVLWSTCDGLLLTSKLQQVIRVENAQARGINTLYTCTFHHQHIHSKVVCEKAVDLKQKGKKSKSFYNNFRSFCSDADSPQIGGEYFSLPKKKIMHKKIQTNYPLVLWILRNVPF